MKVCIPSGKVFFVQDVHRIGILGVTALSDTLPRRSPALLARLRNRNRETSWFATGLQLSAQEVDQMVSSGHFTGPEQAASDLAAHGWPHCERSQACGWSHAWGGRGE